MKNVAQIHLWRETIKEQFSPLLIFSILALAVALFLGVAIGVFDLIYGIATAGFLIIVIILLLSWDELMVMLIIAVHIFVDWYIGWRLISVLMGLVLLFVCYCRQSNDHTRFKTRPIWLWGLFLTLTIYPAIKGGSLRLYDADTYYPSIVLSAFIMFWLGNMIAKDISAVRRVFQFLSVLSMFIAIHTIIEATTGKFLFESARAEAVLAQNSGYQLTLNSSLGASISRAGSFLGDPNGNATFLVISFFLSLGLFIESKQFFAKMLYFLQLLLILLALMFTYSTGAWIAVLAGMVAFVIFVGRKRYSIFLLILITVLTAIVFTIFPSQLALQLAHANGQNESSLHVASWQTAIRVIEAFPLFGVGLGGQAYMLFADPYRVPAQIVPLQEPDNSYLQWGAMAGIPVMLIFLLLLGYIFWFSWRNWRSIETRYRPLIGAGIVALIALSVNSLSVDGWTNPGGTACLGWLIAGLVASPLVARYQHRQSISSIDKIAESSPVRTVPSRMGKSRFMK